VSGRKHASADPADANAAPVINRPAPPAKRIWQLVISSILLAIWILFLAWMAWRPA
jgi:hypothetical protein